MANKSHNDHKPGYSHLFTDTPSKRKYHPIDAGQFEDNDCPVNTEAHDIPNPPPSQDCLQENDSASTESSWLEKVSIEDTDARQSEIADMPVPDRAVEWASDSDDDDDFDDDFEFWDERVGPNSQAVQALHKNFQTSDELFRKFSSKISVEKFEGVENLPSGAGNKILTASKRAMSQGIKVKDKQDRATVEQVLDPRTRMILYKLLSSGKIVSIDGCISTGKEANVYHATGPDDTALAIKIYKTSILTFKARDKYVDGEFRFRQGYCKKNPRKMVRLWAEKEYRNLLRIHTCGTIKVPHPKILKSHVLVMDFIGENGWPCPLLKDVKFSSLDLGEVEVEGDKDGISSSDNNQDPVQRLVTDLYRQCLIILYRLFKHCKLVHADFSEFNLILKDYKDLYVIDVSQSVEHDHPRSFDFLRHDIKNVQEFFGKLILVGDYQEIFEYITSPNVDDSNCDAVLANIMKNSKKLESFNVSDEVFRQTHIPRKMQEVVHYERDYEKMKKGETELVYTKVMGMKPDMSGPENPPTSSKNHNPATDDIIHRIKNVSIEERLERDNDPGVEENDESSSDSESGTEESEDEGEGKSKGAAVRPKNETQEEKKLRKKQVKEEKAEKRKSKVKKHVKKRKEKLAHANSKR